MNEIICNMISTLFLFIFIFIFIFYFLFFHFLFFNSFILSYENEL